ncbi:type II secretion system secretin GspD [Comamonas serinivorans]|nr:type II secretion system secretin GspD [Comamonas serinivorans]
MGSPSPLARALALVMLSAPLSLGMAPAALAAGDQPELRRGASVTLNFMNAEIDAVARAVATLTGRNVVVDPRVKGTINLVSTNPVTPGEAVQMFVQQLRTQGFAMVFANGLYTVVPEAEAKLQTGSVSAGKVPAAGGQIITQIFRLNHESAANLVPVLRPLISPNNTINVSPSTNALIITDYADNLQRIARIVGTLDVNNATSVEVIKLRHAVASDLAPVIMRLVESGGNGNLPTASPAAGSAPGAQVNIAAAAPASGADTAYRTTLMPEPRSNSLILRAANAAKAAQVRDLIAKLDQPAESNSGYMGGNIHVVHLKNADAAKLAVTLRAALASLPGANASGTGTAGAQQGVANTGANVGAGVVPANASAGMTGNTGASGSISTGPTINAASNNQPSTGGQIQADPSTNSIIISAPEPVYRQLRAVIDRLDERRAQVYIEALIAEVNDSLDADFGVQLQAVLGNAVAIGTNFNNGTSTNLLQLAAAAAAYGNNGSSTNLNNLGSVLPGPGTNMIGGVDFGSGNKLGVLANFLQTSGAGNVLSRPTLLTLDNEEARIVVGQNVPFVTGSYTTTSNSSTNPFQTYERQDVGLTLRVRPQISEDGTVKLVIYQEASSLQSGTTASGYITNKRSIESSVVVDDGSIVVLGGLMQDTYSESEDKVPVLGDVPIVGNLFKSRSRTGSKSNLMVFLRPVVLRDGYQADEFSQGRYQEMQTHQRASQPRPSVSTPVNRSAVLPDLPPRPIPESTSKLVVDPANSVTPAPSRQPLKPTPPAALPTAPYGADYSPSSRTSGTGPSERYDPSLYVN